MQAFDTSSIIHAWDHYPLKQFPKLWDWLGEEFKAGVFAMSAVAEGETRDRDPDCCAWLHRHNVKVLPITQAILGDAIKLKAILGIVHERDYRAGVGENDLIIIATCMQSRIELISNEGLQNILPQNLANCKIPAVCRMNGVNVTCIDFRELLIRSGKVF